MSISPCKIGLKKNIIKKDVFYREILLCKELYQKNKGKCGWGKCKDCGVIFLLHKLYEGKLVEDKNKIKKFRKKIFKI